MMRTLKKHVIFLVETSPLLGRMMSTWLSELSWGRPVRVPIFNGIGTY